MATIMQLYKTPPHGEKEDGGMDDYKKKLFHHRAGQGIRFLVCVVVVLVVILGIWLWNQNRTYTGYEVTSSTEHSSTVTTQYAEYGRYLLRYSRDGISCVDSREEAVWSQTYNMQYPILDVCGGAAAVADRQGNEAYVFREDGLQAQITTRLPIQQISVSSQGVTALLLDGGSVSWIYLYDKEGNVLADSRCSLDETGQPLSISISQAGTKLAVAYLQVRNGAAAGCVVFYNFGAVGNNFVDKIVSSKVYEDTVIPRVEYLDSTVCAVVSDQGLFYYEGAEIPEETAAVEVQAEIRSVFFGEDCVGIITEGKAVEEQAVEEQAAEEQDAGKQAAEEQERFRVELYGTEGQTLLSVGTSLKYTQAKISREMLILSGEDDCEIYSMQGVLKYAGSFGTGLADLYKARGFGRYTAVFPDRTDTVKLK